MSSLGKATLHLHMTNFKFSHTFQDQYKTKILPAAVHLKTADGSAMSSLGKATLHLHMTNFKFSHTFQDQYKTKILPAAVHLKTADGSAMSSLGKATLHLHMTNFKFSHTFVICDKLPDTDCYVRQCLLFMFYYSIV